MKTRDWIQEKVHKEFYKLVEKIKLDRLKREKDKKPKSFSKITKTMTNMINANPKIYDAIVEVEDGNI